MRRVAILSSAALALCSLASGRTNGGHVVRERPSKEPSGKPESKFLVGGDISMLARIEELGGVYREDGKPRDAIAIFTGHGCNCFRLRLFVDPNHENQVVNDLGYTLALAGRIKAAGAKFLLDFHYSDTWADPAHQVKPAAWRDLDFESLVERAADYTASAMAEFRRRGALPDIVQVGNEITPGFLWPDGKLWGEGDPEEKWERFTRLVKACIEGVKRPLAADDAVRIMIHIDRGGDWGATEWFFENLTRRDVPFDLVGLSYYPWWHGSMDALRDNLRRTAGKFGRDIVVVETAYPHIGAKWWAEKPNMAWPVSPEGQRQFLTELMEAAGEAPRTVGVIYWYPEAIPVEGLNVWNGGATALFDGRGNALPGLEAFRFRPRRPNQGPRDR